MRILLSFALFTLVCAGHAQTWEVGGVGGGGFSPQLTVSNAAGRAITGFTNTSAFGGLLGQNLYHSIGGEIRYTFQPTDLQISASGSEVKFQGLSHAIHYDLLIHTRPFGSPVRPFLSAGGGVRVFQGTGSESAYQPLQEFALLTKTQEWKPLISIGGGAKIALSRRVLLRVELRDYVTPFPKEVIAPAIGAKLSGWLHDIVPLAGVSVLL